MKAVYPGTFDPFTLGHADIAARAAQIFDKLYIAIAEENSKNTAAGQIRKRITEMSLAGIKGLNFNKIEIEVFSGLTTDFALRRGCGVIVRGIRNILDTEYEKNLASVYKSLADIEVVNFFACGVEHISSSVVRDLIKAGASLKGYVSENVIEEIAKLYGKN